MTFATKPTKVWSGSAWVTKPAKVWSGSAWVTKPVKVEGAGSSSEAAAFLARTSSLDGTHTSAYTALIDGLVADGVFAKFDALYIFATEDTTNAHLNLVSSSFPITPSGSVTFTADRGYIANSVGANTLNTAFNPTTASSPKFVQNSAHMAVWNNTNVVNGDAPGIGQGAGVHIFLKYADGSIYSRVNDASEAGGYAIGNPIGLLIGNRSASNAIQAYHNGSALGSASNASKAVTNAAMQILSAGGNSDNTHQLAAASIGASLNATDAANYYTRLAAYMTAVGNV